jgi:Tol biopolymer transport system component
MSVWGASQLRTDLSSARNEGRVGMRGDGLCAVLASGTTSSDLWETCRSATTAPFPSATTTLTATLNDNDVQFDPELSSDGLRVYYSYDAGGATYPTIVVAERATVTSSFATAVTVQGITITALSSEHTGPALSPDELVIVYGAVPAGDRNLFFATRSDRMQPFSGITLVPGVSSQQRDSEPDVSSDGCELYFMSARNRSSQIFVASAM